MNNKLSRLLALLLSVVLLVSGTTAAFAEGVNEVGNVNDIEEMVFERVKELFPESDNEQRYLFISYYESDSAAKADALLATLSDEERIAFIDWRAENGKCIEGCGGASGCTVIDCTCLCHKVEEFNRNMDAFIDSLESLDMDEAIKFIAELRMDELEAYWEANYRPIITAGAPGYEEQFQEAAVMTLSAEEETDNSISDPETFSTTLNTLIDNADASTLDNPAKDSVLNVANTYSAVGASLEDTYGAGTDTSDYLSSNQPATFGLMRSMDTMVTGDTGEAATTYALTRAVTPQATSLLPNNTDVIEKDNVKIRLFNYDETINSKYTNWMFSQSSGYHDNAVDGYEGLPAVDGDSSKVNKETINKPTMSNTLNTSGYPVSTNVTGGTIQSLFDGTYAAVKNVTEGDTGLFWQDGDYYLFDSAERHAVYDGENFTLYDGSVRPWYFETNSTDHTAAGLTAAQAGNFLPFNDNNVFSDPLGVTSHYIVKQPDLWFGMTVEFDFYMPKDGLVNGQNMEFEFQGDDDVWVYIDDTLVLDIGGTHGAETGTINFATGEVVDPTGTEKTLKSLFNLNKVTFDNYSQHKLKFFYLERGGNISYCKLKFNMPTLPKNSLSVIKEVVGTVTDQASDIQYTFELKDKDGNPVADKEYVLYGTLLDGDTETGNKTDSNGRFKLRKDQNAIFEFEGSATEKTYVVKELSDGHVQHVTYPEGATEIEETTDGYSATIDIPKDGQMNVLFENHLKTVDFKVTKEVINPTASDADREYNFEAYVYSSDAEDAEPYVVNNADPQGYTIGNDGKLTFSLKANGTVQIGPLPIGAKVVVTETGTSKEGEAVNAVPVTRFETTATSTGTVEVENVTGLNGTTYTTYLDRDINNETEGAEIPEIVFTNTRKYFPLTITKKGLDETLDAHPSTMYSVVGPDTDMTVAINGNSSVTINDLPGGTYTVTELTDWSWRYTSSSDQTDNQVLVDGVKDTITFTNSREKKYWLDGEAAAEENQFKVNDTDTSAILLKEIDETDESDEENYFVG